MVVVRPRRPFVAAHADVEPVVDGRERMARKHHDAHSIESKFSLETSMRAGTIRPMSCPSAEQLASMAEGSIDDAGSAHVETCETCREVIRIVKASGPDRNEPGVINEKATHPSPGDSIGR